ncbi:SRPBCC family protein [Actinokineospora sp. G85]|uniref:SRPBCC family protein n=1 Tax=Actinokineospora sp. G85 TaxID=3406626 RepID=UPI003C788374
MGAVAHYIEVDAPAQACYDWWRSFEKLPRVLSDVREVKAKDGGGHRTVWTVDGPLGKTLTWEADIVEDEAPHKIAWATVDSTDPDVKNSGVVRFDDKGNGRTGFEISLAYDPPAGKLGEAVASLFSDPQKKVERAAAEFKTIIEAR